MSSFNYIITNGAVCQFNKNIASVMAFTGGHGGVHPPSTQEAETGRSLRTRTVRNTQSNLVLKTKNNKKAFTYYFQACGLKTSFPRGWTLSEYFLKNKRSCKQKVWASETARWVKAVAARPDNLSSIQLRGLSYKPLLPGLTVPVR